ncbi:cytochrome c oxidase subunit I [Sphingobacteriales bacterium UPWRP_1]|nr:cytochrome c oxidase subunit I [Sphingobacteriales bacterium TSM_CSM]PSJ78051.1 cytochrome c oxidase subunit I [Sphingobacteriales bacterium UPWRP_1]
MATIESGTEIKINVHDHHDHEHDHHHEESFISKYIFSQDHKMISRQFLITGIFWSFVGVLFSVLFRLQLAWPDESFPILETLLGKWAAGGKLAPNFYYALVTMHGTIMVFFVLTAGLSGTFSNLLIPLQIGARDMASPFLNMLSYWFFFLSGFIMLVSLFISTGPADGGWTAYPPLNALPQASSGSQFGMTLWLLSMAMFVVSSLLGGLNYITTILNMRTEGMTMMRLPLTIWAFFFTAVLGVLSFPVLLSGAILLLFDRHLGTSFYLSDIYIGGQPLTNAAGELLQGGSPILFQHLFWFLGHPEVYIIILPAMGMVSHVLATNSRKPIFGYSAMVMSILAITVLAFLVWAHHMFVSGLNPFIGSIFVLFTLLIAVPSAIKVFNWIGTIWRGNINFTPDTLFAIGFVSLFISGGLTGIYLGNSALDIPLHDTYFVVAHFHIVMGLAGGFGLFVGVYHWFPKMFNGRQMNNTMGYIHFWVTFVGSYLIFWPMHYMGMTGVPRRYFQFSNFETFNVYGELNVFITIAALVVFFAQFIFLINFIYSALYGPKIKTLNPYLSNTLEWTTPIEPGHGNWPGAIPPVYRGPYEYGKNGTDFVPQHLPDNAIWPKEEKETKTELA